MGNIQFYNNKILFVDDKVAMASPCCCGMEDCQNGCDPGAVPDEIELEISGYTADCVGYPGDCTYLNGIYTLAWQHDCGEYAHALLDFVFCSWGYSIPANGNCAGGLVCAAVGIVYGTPNQYALSVCLGGGMGDFADYRKLYGTSKPDCNSWSSENVPWISGSTICSGSGTTAEVTF